MLIDYVKHIAIYKFLVLKSDVLQYNTIIETKNVKFFEHIYPLNDKISHVTKILSTPLDDINKINKILGRSKKMKKRNFFWK